MTRLMDELQLEAARSTLQAAQQNYNSHEMTMNNWAISGQMQRDKNCIRRAEARVNELETARKERAA